MVAMIMHSGGERVSLDLAHGGASDAAPDLLERPADARSGLWIGPSTGPFHDPSNFNEVFLGAFRRDVLSFYPGSRIDASRP